MQASGEAHNVRQRRGALGVASAMLAATWVATAGAERVAPSSDTAVDDDTPGRTEVSLASSPAGTFLAEHGIGLEAYYTFEAFGNVHGGQRRGEALLGDVDLLLTLDLETLVGWRGAEVFLYGLGLHGEPPSALVGDAQGVSNIEAPPEWKLFEAWLEQSMLDDRLSVLVGLYDVNSEFDVIPAASLFAHSSPGMGADIGTWGRNGPSSFPATSLAARVELRARDDLYLRFVVADGVPGDPDDPTGALVRFNDGDGVLLVGEVGLFSLPPKQERGRRRHEIEELDSGEIIPGHFGKIALGVWGSTTELDDYVRVVPGGAPFTRRGSHGAYLLAERWVYYEPDAPVEGLALYGRLGIADRATTRVDGYVGVGAVYRGLVRGRSDDLMGLSVAAAHVGRDFRRALRRDGVPTEPWEVAIEWTYRARLLPWLTIQPSVHYVVDPALGPRVRDAVAVAGRVIIGL